MEQTGTNFKTGVADPLQALGGELRDLRNYVMLNPNIQEQHGNFVEKLKRLDDEAGRVMYQSKRVSRRY